MMDICNEDECNDTYGRIRMYQALQLKQPEGVHIPGERTVYRVMEEIGLNHKPKRIQCSGELSFTVTEEHSRQVRYIVKQSANMAFSKA